jgi:hypothetical protein
MSVVIDISHLQTDPPQSPEIYRKSAGRPVERDPSTIDSIVIHQAATDFHVSSGQVANAGGDRHEALHRRALTVASHATVFGGEAAGVDCGHAVISKPLRWYVNHADQLNSRSLGLEIEGRYPLHMDAPMMSDRLVYAAREGVRALWQKGRDEGMPIRYIWAHRQSNKDRGGDPGEEIWKRVVLEYAVPVLGLEPLPDAVVGDGRPIPDGWQDVTFVRGESGVGRVAGIILGIVGIGSCAGLLGWTAYTSRRRA